jgi:DnaJ-class molecular chaperone
MSGATNNAIAERPADKCPDCGGTGKVIGYSLMTGNELAEMLCPTCEGSGKKSNADRR